MQDNNTINTLVKSIFGFDEFRPNQEEIVNAIMAGRDVVAVMPTGGGKSLCYQLPSRTLPGTVIVVSPLIALMKDQVDAARDNGFRAAFMNSSMTYDEKAEVRNDIRQGKLELLYLAPEQLNMDWFTPVLSGVRISLIAIDEAHCISEWGHDFRPEYLRLGQLRKQFPKVPIAAFTATATKKAQSDIIEKLGVKNPMVVRASFNRPNLFYEVKKKSDIDNQLLEFVREHDKLSGIIYRTTRDSVMKTAGFLRENGVKAVAYHAGMDNETRARHQDMFQEDEAHVVVATIAFGMGIDKPNVRFVGHADLPKNIESYYQETGRAGRDGEAARCTLFYNGGDVFRLKRLLQGIEDKSHREIALAKLDSVARFATCNACRRKQLLAYFDEPFPDKECGGCDACASERIETDATDDSRLLLSAIEQTGQRYGPSYLRDVLTGSDEDVRIKANGHDAIPAFGAGRHQTKIFWNSLAGELADSNLIERQGEYGVLVLTDLGKNLLESENATFAVETAITSPKTTARDNFVKDNPELFERLRKIRKNFATSKRIRAYVVFSDRTLRDMCSKLPVTREQMLMINGVGTRKWESYGQNFLDEIVEYANEKGLADAELSPAQPETPFNGPAKNEGELVKAMRAFVDKRLGERGAPVAAKRLKYETRIKIIRMKPRTLDELGRIKGLGAKMISLIGEDILDYVREACFGETETECPQPEPPLPRDAPAALPLPAEKLPDAAAPPPPPRNPVNTIKAPIRKPVSNLKKPQPIPKKTAPAFWNDERIKELERLACSFTVEQLEIIFQRPRSEIESIIWSVASEPSENPPHARWTAEMDIELLDLAELHDIPQMAKILNRTQEAISSRLKKLGFAADTM